MDAILHRRPATLWERFISSPSLLLAQTLYFYTAAPERAVPFSEDGSQIRVVCISDTHNTQASQPPLPPGDILIHSGDLTDSGTRQELDDVLSWLSDQPHHFKVFIAGNHDRCLSPVPEEDNASDIRAYIAKRYPSLSYLCDNSIEVVVRGRSLRLYGSPWTPKQGNWVFQYPRIRPQQTSSTDGSSNGSHDATVIWSRIPVMTDILITHGPPFGHLDAHSRSASIGCVALLSSLWRTRTKLHVFGHVHAARGTRRVTWGRAQRMYEEVCMGKRGLGGVVMLAWWTAVEWLRDWKRTWFLGRVKDSMMQSGTTQLVNAASVAGMKNERKMGALVVEI